MIGEDLREPAGFLERRRSGIAAEGGGRAVVEKEACSPTGDGPII